MCVCVWGGGGSILIYVASESTPTMVCIASNAVGSSIRHLIRRSMVVSELTATVSPASRYSPSSLTVTLY